MQKALRLISSIGPLTFKKIVVTMMAIGVRVTIILVFLPQYKTINGLQLYKEKKWVTKINQFMSLILN